jgi:DNA-binding NtrC family response regulator
MNDKNLKIFVVDDDIFHLHAVKKVLSNLGHQDVSVYSNGVDCMMDINQQPDIIFLDHNMDHYTGYEVLRKVKRFNPNIIVIMLSAQEEIKIAVDSLKHGAFDYLMKGADLKDKIENVMKKIEDFHNIIETRKPSLLKTISKYF